MLGYLGPQPGCPTPPTPVPFKLFRGCPCRGLHLGTPHSRADPAELSRTGKWHA